MFSNILAASALAMLFATPVFADATRATPDSASADKSIRPFRIHIPQAALDDLRHRVRATRLPDKETANDSLQGPQLATMQALVKYWDTQYDWRKLEAQLNKLPQFTTTIDGVDIHFIHVRSKQPNALPVIITVSRFDRRTDRPDRSAH